MTIDQVVQLGRMTLETTLWLAAPVLVVTVVVSLLINVVQVLTSLQDATVSTVPRLAAAAGAALFFMPWMVRRIAAFTVFVISNLRQYAN